MIKEDKTTQATPENSETSLQTHPDKNEFWYADLIDLRVIVFLVSIAVMAMTATVLLFSSDNDASTNGDPETDDQGTKNPALVAANPNSNPTKKANASQEVVGDTQEFSKPVVEQASDGGFGLPIRSAVVLGCKADSTGISNWQIGGSAQWRLAISDRRTGFFHCYVTYQSKFESQFSVQLGDRLPLKFTVYPHETDFTEQFIVRLDTPNEPSLRLIANQVEKVSGVTVKQIRLVPR